jgi:ubiquinone/menaquinone biosynthesis C-methylase UbiE
MDEMRLALLLATTYLYPGFLSAQATHPVSGRKIAGVMGVGGADWLVRPERQEEEDPARALELLDLQPGMKVGDVGAGVGFWSFLIAGKIGPEGKVYATDIQSGMIERLRKRIKDNGIGNVEPILSSESATGLPANTLDLVILVDVYHEFSKPQEMLRDIARALKPNGRLALLEYRKEDKWIPIREEHKMSIPMVRQELEAENYRFVKVYSDLPWQHLFFFRKGAIQ